MCTYIHYILTYFKVQYCVGSLIVGLTSSELSMTISFLQVRAAGATSQKYDTKIGISWNFLRTMHLIKTKTEYRRYHGCKQSTRNMVPKWFSMIFIRWLYNKQHCSYSSYIIFILLVFGKQLYYMTVVRWYLYLPMWHYE